MITLKTFEDIVFKPHKVYPNSKMALIKFPNGHSLSVVGGRPTSDMWVLYGDGVTSFEIWCSDEEDVRGWQTPEQVTEQMIRLQLIK